MPTEEEMGVLYKLCYVSTQISDDDDTELTRLYQDLKREYFNGHSFENMFPSEKQKEENLRDFIDNFPYSCEEEEHTSAEPEKEQKPVECELEDAFKYYTDAGITVSCGDIVAKPKEQKPAEKQGYSGLNDFEKAIHRGFLSVGVENVPVTIIKETAQECLAKMKPAEWSEEDKKIIDTIVSVLGQYIDYKAVSGTGSGYATQRYSKEIDWLNSLRPQYHGDVTMTEAYKMGKEAGKASHWKPSEEQMETLYKAIPVCMGVVGRDEIVPLESLYEQLKKLM